MTTVADKDYIIHNWIFFLNSSNLSNSEMHNMCTSTVQGSQVLVFDSWFLYLIITVFVVMAHPTTGYLDNRCYRELRSYLRHGMTGRNFFDVFLFFLDFKDYIIHNWIFFLNSSNLSNSEMHNMCTSTVQGLNNVEWKLTVTRLHKLGTSQCSRQTDGWTELRAPCTCTHHWGMQM
jgi:hypothetical protein